MEPGVFFWLFQSFTSLFFTSCIPKNDLEEIVTDRWLAYNKVERIAAVLA
jgi:hypothetical protein